MVRFFYLPVASLFSLSPEIIFLGGCFISPVSVVVIVVYSTSVDLDSKQEKKKINLKFHACHFYFI